MGRVKNEQTKGCNKVRVENNIAIGLGLVEHQAVFPKFHGVSQEMFFGVGWTQIRRFTSRNQLVTLKLTSKTGKMKFPVGFRGYNQFLEENTKSPGLSGPKCILYIYICMNF